MIMTIMMMIAIGLMMVINISNENEDDTNNDSRLDTLDHQTKVIIK